MTLVESTLVEMVISEAPAKPLGDDAYNSDKLDAELRQYGIEVIAPHLNNRKNKTQDSRRLRRYRRRWKIERLGFRTFADLLHVMRYCRELPGYGSPRLLSYPAAAFMRWC